MLESRIVERQSPTSFGVRIDRSLTPRFGVEFALDEAQGELTLRSSSKDVASASQASFPAMWNLLLSALSSGSQVVTSDAMIDDKRGRQLVTSGTLLINLLSSTSFTPYVAVGAGYITAHNGAPSMTLVGNYSFTFAPIPVTPIPPFHINETDTVKIQAAARNSMTWVFGGGVKYALGDRWGVRADLRDQPRRRSNHGDDKPDVSTRRIRNVDSCLVAKRSATRLRFVTFIFVDAQHSGSRIPDVFRIGTRESSERVSGSLLAILTRASDACRATSLPATRSS
jgi:hypothetical protein